MPPAADFRLYHGNDLSLLAQLLAAELAKPAPGANLLVPDTILIPQPAMRRWLQLTLAETHGIAANLRFLTPGEFVAEALAANLPGDDRAIADPATLRWRLWTLLADPAALAAMPGTAPLQPLLAGADRALAAWALAGELAAAFEKYQAWRKEWLLRWDDPRHDRDDWQAELWRRASAGSDHRGRRLQAYLQRHDGDAAIAPRGLPPRLFAFACQNVSPDVLRVIASAALAGPLHFYFVSPVQGWWGDLQTARERRREIADHDGRGAVADDDEHPLLRANGGAGRDFVDLLFADERIRLDWEQPVPVEPAGDRLLPRLQRDLLRRRAPAAGGHFDAADRSLQLHACHTPLREVQVLHDQLRDLLEHDPTLQPRDIAVLTPDIDAYAPLVHAVFGGAAAAEAIPYTVADSSRVAGQPLAQWFLRLLALPTARFTLAEGLELLSLPPVARRLGLAAADLERLAEALRAAGARWGRDGERRAAVSGDADDAYSWRWALDRLLLGHAGGDDAAFAGMAPLPWLEGGEFVALDGLLTGLEVLDRLARDLAAALPPATWPRRLAAALDELLPDRPADAGERRAFEALRAGIGALATELATADVHAPVPPDVVQAWFQERLQAADDRQPFLGGGVTFARMVPMRLIPFRVICLLGMNDGDFPRRDPGGALNRLAAELRGSQRRIGDRSVRDDDRYLFLQLLASAGDVFYLSWLGRDPRSDAVRAPAVVVAELIDVAATMCGGAAARQLVLEHPLQPFAAAAFGVPLSAAETPVEAARRVGYQARWRPAALTAADARAPLPPFVATALAEPAEVPLEMTRATLFAALANPSKHFLRQRLDLRLPQPDDPLPDAEPFDRADPLQRHRCARRLFTWLRAGVDDEATLHARLLAEALLPPGPPGREALRALLGLVAGPARAARLWAADAATAQPWRLALPGGRTLSGTFADVHANGLLQFRPGAMHGRAVLDFGIDWLAWHASGETRPVHRLLPALAPRDLPVPAAAAALAALAGFVDVAVRAGRQALPFLPRSGWKLQVGLAADADGAWDEAQKEWCGSDSAASFAEADDAWVRLALRGRDPFVDDDDGARRHFAELARQVFAPLQRMEPGDV